MTSTLPMIMPQPYSSQRAGKPSGQKAPLQPKEAWAIRVRLQLAARLRDPALFNLAIDSKFRRRDLARLPVADVAPQGTACLVVLCRDDGSEESAKNTGQRDRCQYPGGAHGRSLAEPVAAARG